MALLQKNGYGQVEPNNITGRRSGRVYAQKALRADMAATLESGKLQNGMFLVYDLLEGCHTDGSKGELGLVYNEVKVYRDTEGAKDFYVAAGSDGLIFPRILGLTKGDVFTTNLVDITTPHGTGALVGVKLVPQANGVLKQVADTTDAPIVLTIVKETTMPDGQKAVKVQYL